MPGPDGNRFARVARQLTAALRISVSFSACRRNPAGEQAIVFVGIRFDGGAGDGFHGHYDELADALDKAGLLLEPVGAWRSKNGPDSAGLSGFTFDTLRYFYDLERFVTASLLTALAVGTSKRVVDLLKIWLENRNGRKIRIKVGDIEIEATQISSPEVLELLKKAADLYDKLPNAANRRQALATRAEKFGEPTQENITGE